MTRADPTPRRLWLIRHGETEGRSSIRYYGSTDVRLSERGREQIRRLAPTLASVDFAALIHSPLARARESAEIIGGALASPPGAFEAEDDLREVDFGDLEGMTAADIEREHPDWFREWRAGRAERYPGGESLDGFWSRVASGIDEVLARHRAGDLCAVVHRGVVKAALSHLLAIEREPLRAWPLDLATATVVVAADGGGWHLERYNLRAPPA